MVTVTCLFRGGVSPLPHCVTFFPEQALQCRVAGVAAGAGGWKEECSLFLKQLLFGKSVAVHVLNVTGEGRSLYTVDMKLASTGMERKEVELVMVWLGLAFLRANSNIIIKWLIFPVIF